MVDRVKCFLIRAEGDAAEEKAYYAHTADQAVKLWAERIGKYGDLADEGACTVLHVRHGQSIKRWYIQAKVVASYKVRPATELD